MTNATTAVRTRIPANWRVLGAVAVVLLAWASAFVVIRAIGAQYAPGPLALGRILVAALALSGLMLRVRQTWVRPTQREWLLLLACGSLWFGVYNVALNAAERRVDASTAALLVNIGPVLIALFAGALLHEGFPRWLLAGAGVAFAGVAIIGLSTARSDSTDVVGVLLCLLAAVTYAAGVIAQKPLLRRLPALQVTWLASLVASAVLLPFVGGLVHDVTTADAGSTLGVIYLGLIPTALAFSLWAYALARTDAGRLAVTTYLVPPLVVLGSWLLLGEVPPILTIVGGAIALAGVAISRRR